MNSLPTTYTPAIDELRRLIRESGLTLTKISHASGVSYTSLWKFTTGKQDSFGLLDGEKVYYALTGKTFLR